MLVFFANLVVNEPPIPMIPFFKEVFHTFLSSNTFQKGASLAYYAVFSLLPIVIIITSLLGLFFGEQAVSGEIQHELKDALGNDAAKQLQAIIKNQQTQHNGFITTIIGFFTLALSASFMFSQIHNSFNNIWNIKAKPKSSILKYFSKHITSFLFLIASFSIILISTLVGSFFIKYAENFHSNYAFLYVYEHLLSFAVMGIVFALMFRLLGDAILNWKATLIGGAITALLFVFGKVGIGMVIAHIHVSSTFGSASVLALLMLWVYYTSQIMFLGASFVKVVSARLGYEIQPNSSAIKIKHVAIS